MGDECEEKWEGKDKKKIRRGEQLVVGRRQLVEEWKGERRNGWMERMMDVD